MQSKLNFSHSNVNLVDYVSIVLLINYSILTQFAKNIH